MIELFTAVIKHKDSSEEQRANAYYNRGGRYGQLNPPQYQEAIADYTEAIKLFKDDNDKALAYYNRGVSYRELNQHQEAIYHYTEAD